ncbi:MAG: ShlB/FhaC/HecB family hemolysin secretion/activation protein, partial [Pseudomonadota bacterium]
MNVFTSHRALCIWAGVFLLSLAPEAAAQTAGDINAAGRQADQVQRALTEQLRRSQPQPRAPSGTRALRPGVQTRGGENQQCFEIRRIEVDGAKLITPDAMAKAVEPFEEQCLDLVGLNSVLKQVTFLYVSRGFVASRAYLPEQDLGGGTLKIAVIEGQLRDVVLNGKPGAQREQIASAFPDLEGKPLNLRDVEQGLDQINRLRSRNATVKLAPGKRQGETTVEIAENASKPWHVTVGSDNLGSEASGAYQRTAGIEIDNTFGINDRFTFNIQESVCEHPFRLSQDEPYGQMFSGSFSVPYGYWLFSMDASKSRYLSTIPGTLSDIDTSGTSILVNASVDRVIHRDQISRTTLTGGFTFKDNDTFILGSLIDTSSRKLSIASASLNHARQAAGGLLSGVVMYYQGLDVLGAFDDDRAPEGSPKGQ